MAGRLLSVGVASELHRIPNFYPDGLKCLWTTFSDARSDEIDPKIDAFRQAGFSFFSRQFLVR